MSHKGRLIICVGGDHPQLDLIRDHLHRKGCVVRDIGEDNFVEHIDFILWGGNERFNDWLDLYPETPILLLSHYSMFKGTFFRDRVREDDAAAIHPLADFTKEGFPYLDSETTILSYHTAPTMVVRTFPLMGDEETILEKLCDKAKACDPQEDLMWGNRRRSWIHKSDFLEGIDRLMHAFGRGTTGIYNLGSELEMSISELNDAVFRAAGLPPGDLIEEEWWEMPWRPNILVPDMTRTQAVTKWRPRVSVRAYLKEVFQ